MFVVGSWIRCSKTAIKLCAWTWLLPAFDKVLEHRDFYPTSQKTGKQGFRNRQAQQATIQSLLLEDAAVVQGDLDLSQKSRARAASEL